MPLKAPALIKAATDTATRTAGLQLIDAILALEKSLEHLSNAVLAEKPLVARAGEVAFSRSIAQLTWLISAWNDIYFAANQDARTINQYPGVVQVTPDLFMQVQLVNDKKAALAVVAREYQRVAKLSGLYKAGQRNELIAVELGHARMSNFALRHALRKIAIVPGATTHVRIRRVLSSFGVTKRSLQQTFDELDGNSTAQALLMKKHGQLSASSKIRKEIAVSPHFKAFCRNEAMKWGSVPASLPIIIGPSLDGVVLYEEIEPKFRTTRKSPPAAVMGKK
jgi:hypothetical protein